MPMQAISPEVIETFSAPYIRADGTCDIVVEQYVRGYGETSYKRRSERTETLPKEAVDAVLATDPPPGMTIGQAVGQRVIEKLVELGKILAGTYLPLAPWDAPSAPQGDPQDGAQG